MKRATVTVLCLAVLLTLLVPALGRAIVSANPASQNMQTDPHLVPEPGDSFDPDDYGVFGAAPPLDTRGVVRVDLTFDTGEGFCSGAVVSTPQAPPMKAVLTAAHCSVRPDHFLQQVKVTIPSQGGPVEYSTCFQDSPSDPKCDLGDFVYVHPSYSQPLHAYDLALIYFENPIVFNEMTYNVVDSELQLNGATVPFIKFGFGCSGYGGDGVDPFDASNYDGRKRWAMNAWDSHGLGQFGVTFDEGSCQGTFQNDSKQLVLDHDNYTQITNNVFNFYMLTFDPATGSIIVDNRTYSWGVWGVEAWGCPGDSGGPNFIYDPDTSGGWLIAAVTSWLLRMDDDYPGFSGNSDLTPHYSPTATNCGRDFSIGELGGDSIVNEDLLEEILGLRAPSGGVAGGGALIPSEALGMAPIPSKLFR